MAGKFRYLGMDDREKIAEMWENGARVEDIAAAVGVCQKTIYRELQRGWDGTVGDNLRRTYDPVRAENLARAAISERGRRNASQKGVGVV